MKTDCTRSTATSSFEVETMRFKGCAPLITSFKRSQKFQLRRMAEEADRPTIIPPPPPDNLQYIMIGGIVSFAAICTAYIASLPANNYDSIGLMGAPGQVPPAKADL